MKNLLPLFLFLLFMSHTIQAQDPLRFKEELDDVLDESPEEVAQFQGQVLFTGSSSIRMWQNIGDYFPESSILNRGFGGSEMSDLLYFLDDLVLKYKPKKIFVYEGDNDIANGESPSAILKEARELIAAIRKSQPETPIVFISAKPSISRWELRGKYLELNRFLQELCQNGYQLEYADTWTIMLDEEGNLQQDLFIEDGLHMNSKGYDLWAEVLTEFIKVP